MKLALALALFFVGSSSAVEVAHYGGCYDMTTHKNTCAQDDTVCPAGSMFMGPTALAAYDIVCLCADVDGCSTTEFGYCYNGVTHAARCAFQATDCTADETYQQAEDDRRKLSATEERKLSGEMHCLAEDVVTGACYSMTTHEAYCTYDDTSCAAGETWISPYEAEKTYSMECRAGAAEEDDDDDDICFSGDSTVQLESGATKTMADLQVGDSVLSADPAGKLSYSDVAFLPHGANTKAADFVKVTTESGKAVKATPTHLLVSCDGSLVQAKAAVCLRTVHGDEAVTSIESFKANGIYSAVTLDNEFLVVDGVVASPFALAHGLVNAYYSLHRAAYKAFPSLMKMPAVVSVNSLLAASAVVAMNAVSASEK